MIRREAFPGLPVISPNRQDVLKSSGCNSMSSLVFEYRAWVSLYMFV